MLCCTRGSAEEPPINHYWLLAGDLHTIIFISYKKRIARITNRNWQTDVWFYYLHQFYGLKVFAWMDGRHLQRDMPASQTTCWWWWWHPYPHFQCSSCRLHLFLLIFAVPWEVIFSSCCYYTSSLPPSLSAGWWANAAGSELDGHQREGEIVDLWGQDRQSI